MNGARILAKSFLFITYLLTYFRLVHLYIDLIILTKTSQIVEKNNTYHASFIFLDGKHDVVFFTKSCEDCQHTHQDEVSLRDCQGNVFNYRMLFKTG